MRYLSLNLLMFLVNVFHMKSYNLYFDRNTDIGLIHIGDKFLTCVASDDLRPPEGQEYEKRILKKFDQLTVLYAR